MIAKTKITLLLMLLIMPLIAFARVDAKVKVSYRKIIQLSNGSYTTEHIKPAIITVSFLSGAELRKSSSERYAIMHFPQGKIIIKLDAKDKSNINELRYKDLPGITGGSGIVFGQDDAGPTDAMGMPYRWEIEFHDGTRDNEYIDPTIRRIWYSNSPLFI